MRPRLDIALAALVGVVLVAFLLAISLGGGGSSPSSPATLSNPAGSAGFDGAALPEELPAPQFTLSDQYGRQVSLADSRGQVTVIAFTYSTCGDVCVVIAQQIRGALDELERARQPAVLLVSANPAADTPAHVRAFLEEVSLSGRVQYLSGQLSQLRTIWAEYKVHPADEGRRTFDRYASVLLIDRKGRERVLFEQEQLTPESLAHDIAKLEAE